MKKRLLIKSLLVCFWVLNCPTLFAQPHTDDHRDLAALQNEFLSWKFGMFIHYNMATYARVEWASGKEDPLLFSPKNLDFEQWADAAISANMKYAILTVKHTGGWCLWNSAYTDHDIAQFANYKNGQGDIVKEFTSTFRKKGLKVGLYYCFPLHHREWAQYTTLPIPDYEKGTANAREFIQNQLKELLTQYGPIDVLWIDQYSSINGGLREGDWLTIKSYIHSLQPGCIVIANNATDLNQTDIASYEYPWSNTLPSEDNTMPSEVCDKLQQGWFSSHPKGKDAKPLVDANYIVNEMLRPMNARNANYLLNCAPNEAGLLPKSVVKMLKKVGELLQEETGTANN